MSDKGADFVSGAKLATRREKSHSKSVDLSLCYKKAFFQRKIEDSSVVTRHSKRVKDESERKEIFLDDGLYAMPECPLTSLVIKPYPLARQMSFSENAEKQVYGKLVEIAIRDVIVKSNESRAGPRVASVSVLFKGKMICKTCEPFNRKLHKLFIRNASDSSNFSIQVQAEGGSSSILPLPLPERCVKHKRIEIDFSINHTGDSIYSGIVVCTVSLNIMDMDPKAEASVYLYTPFTNDPNDPRNSFSLAQPKGEATLHNQHLHYFLLHDPALYLSTTVPSSFPKLEVIKKKLVKSPDVVVAEQMFSILDISVRSWFQERRPLRPSSTTGGPKHHAGRKQIFTVTVLRGVEVPVREESALVQPLVEIEWAGVLRATTTSDGPAPVWQQTLQFEVPTSKLSYEHCVKLRLFDHHPVWGMQWLGEARIPFECHRSSQQFERWIGFSSSLYSPNISFGYNQASPGHSFARIYVLMKMEQFGALNPIDSGAVNALCKAVQRCLAVPYKVGDHQAPEDAAGLVMLLDPLPTHYGPLTPRQALNLNKVDHYGRTALLSALLQGLGLQTYVLLGSSQTRKWASFTITIGESSEVTLWDAETGEHYDFQDSRCSLISVSRLVNQYNIWENRQKSVSPVNLKYDPRTSKDWQLLFSNVAANGSRTVPTVDLSVAQDKDEEEVNVITGMEEKLKESFTQWRTALGLPTIFNRHAEAILRDVFGRMKDASEPQVDKKELRQLYRAYYVHGFVVRVRYTDLHDLTSFLRSTKIHAMTGPLEFALVCCVKKLLGKIRAVWLATLVIRNRT